MARSYPLKISKRHLEAAKLYLAGPVNVRGKWAASAREAGFTRVPSFRGKTVQQALEKVRDEGEDIDSSQQELVELLSEDKVDWQEMAPVAKAMLAKIGAGVAEASAGQVSALKEIVARNEGRIGSEPQQDKPIGLVVLPALGSLRESVVDAPPVGEPVLGDRHNRLARQEARREGWKKGRTIPGGGYRSEEHGGPSLKR